MYVKINYDFLKEWFFNVDSFSLDELVIDDIINYIDIKDYKILPVHYSNLINEKILCFIDEREVDNVVPDVKKGIFNASKNIEKIVLKNIKVEFENFTEFKKVFSLIEEKSLIFSFRRKTIVIFVPLLFLTKLLKDIFKYSEYEDFSAANILQTIEKLIYQSNINLFWDMKDFINSLSDKEIQFLINSMLKNNIVEETMLAALIAGVGDDLNKNKIYINLSRNLKKEIADIFKNSYPDSRWISEVELIVKSNIVNIIAGEMSFESLRYINSLREYIKIGKYEKIFKEKPYTLWLEEIYDKGLMEKLRNRAGKNILVKSIIDINVEYLDLISQGLSKKGRDEYKADYHYFSDISDKEIFNARIKVVENIKDIYYEEESRKVKYFNDIILEMDNDMLNLLIMDVGAVRFAQATINSGKDFKRSIYTKVQGTLRNLLLDLYTGKIRFKAGFGEQTVLFLKRAILKEYLWLKDLSV